MTTAKSISREWLFEAKRRIEEGESYKSVGKEVELENGKIKLNVAENTIRRAFQLQEIELPKVSRGRKPNPPTFEQKQLINSCVSQYKGGISKTYLLIKRFQNIVQNPDCEKEKEEIAKEFENIEDLTKDQIFDNLQKIKHHQVEKFMMESGLSSKRDYKPADPPTKYRAISKNLIWHCDIHYLHGNVSFPFFAILNDMTRKVLKTKLLKNKSSNSTANILRKLLEEFIPYCIWTDNGGENRGEFGQVMQENGIVWKHTLPYMPRQNGKVERLWPSLEKFLPDELDDIQQIKDSVQQFIEKYNNTPHLSLDINPKTNSNYTPNELFEVSKFWYEPEMQKWELYIKDEWVLAKFE